MKRRNTLCLWLWGLAFPAYTQSPIWITEQAFVEAVMAYHPAARQAELT